MALAKGRQFFVIAHRWAGLTIALFLTIAGFTGIFLAFNEELEGVFARRLFVAEKPYANAKMLDTSKLISALGEVDKDIYTPYLPLYVEEGRTISIFPQKINPVTNELEKISNDWDEIFINPYTGTIQGYRNWGAIEQGIINIMPFIYKLHYSLALGDFGYWAFGIAAFIWVIDCFIAFYLTLPIKVKKKQLTQSPIIVKLNAWLQKWQPAWKIRWGSGAYKINFDLHRAGGLWIFPMLLVFAWSSVAFNLSTVYMPIMKVFGAVDYFDKIPNLKEPILIPKTEFPQAIKIGEDLAKTISQKNGIEYKHANSISYSSTTGAYYFSFTSSRDFSNRGGASRIIYNAESKQIIGEIWPQTQNGANTFTNWIMALHMGNVFGLPYKIFVSFLGAIVTTLSVTGVIIWMKKRTAREEAIKRRSNKEASNKK